jgi:proteic killer suppression protein
MIHNFKHKGLEKFYLRGSEAGIQSSHAARIRLILGLLNAATNPADVALPGLHLHKLKGDKREFWSLRVSGNWRITFRFNGFDFTDIDYEDYH